MKWREKKANPDDSKPQSTQKRKDEKKWGCFAKGETGACTKRKRNTGQGKQRIHINFGIVAAKTHYQKGHPKTLMTNRGLERPAHMLQELETYSHTAKEGTNDIRCQRTNDHNRKTCYESVNPDQMTPNKKSWAEEDREHRSSQDLLIIKQRSLQAP